MLFDLSRVGVMRLVDQEELLMREVDDDVRRDKYHDAWRKYRVYIIGTIVSIILVVAGNTLWKAHLKSTEAASSDLYATTFDKTKVEEADISAVWAESRSKLSKGYIQLSYLQEGAALIKAGKTDEALIAYDNLANNSDVDERIRDLALLLASRIEYQQSKYAEARGRLVTLSGEENLWTHSANETLALIDIAEGNINSAMSKLAHIAKSRTAPVAIKNRAEELRQLLEPQIIIDEVSTTSIETIDETGTQKLDIEDPEESEE